MAQLFSELHQDQKLRFIWIKKTKHNNANFPCSGRQLYAYSLLSFFYHLRAKTFIVGSGKSDVIRAFVTSKSLVINTWHGPPLKNIYLLDVKERLRNHSFLSKARKIRNSLYPFLDESPDYILSNNKYYIDIMDAAFKPKIGVLEGRLPRWDWLPNRLNSLSFLEGYESIILYAPTFRDSDLSFFPLTELELEKLSLILQEKNICLLVSVHPASNFKLRSNLKNIHSLDGLEVNNIYSQVLPLCNLLISDVSSLLHDSVAFDIPAVIFFPDYETYSTSSRGLLPGYREIVQERGLRGIHQILASWLSEEDSNTYVNNLPFFTVSTQKKVSIQIREIVQKLID